MADIDLIPNDYRTWLGQRSIIAGIYGLVKTDHRMGLFTKETRRAGTRDQNKPGRQPAAALELAQQFAVVLQQTGEYIGEQVLGI